MNSERTIGLVDRARMHAALGDPSRLQIADALLLGDMSPSEVAVLVDLPSNLVAHHLKTLESAGVVTRMRSEADRRRTYVRLSPKVFGQLGPIIVERPHRVVFVCTANSARSHLAAALWRRVSDIPTDSAGTDPAPSIHPGAVAVARRYELALPLVRPQHVDSVVADGDLVVTVCDRAHEAWHEADSIHWSIPDPVRSSRANAFDAALEDLSGRINELSGQLVGSA